MITFFRIITFETAFFLNRFEALVEFLPAFFMRPGRIGKDMLSYLSYRWENLVLETKTASFVIEN